MVTYKLYKNKSSLQQQTSRMLQGGTTEISGNKLAWWERKLLNGVLEYSSVEIDITTHRRPDLLSVQHYDTPAYDWIILQYNNIVDINEEFVSGNIVKVPTMSFIRAYVLNSPVRGHI